MSGPFVHRAGEGAAVAGPALGLVETSSIARGIVVVDAMVKRAPVTIVFARAVSPGKHVVLVSGPEADVAYAMDAGVEVAQATAPTLVDRLTLTQVADELLRALAGKTRAPARDRSLGIVELGSVASSLLSADAACKGAQVELVALRLADGIGGKGYFVLQGEQDQVEAALYAAETIVVPGQLIARELICAPHDDLLSQLK